MSAKNIVVSSHRTQMHMLSTSNPTVSAFNINNIDNGSVTTVVKNSTINSDDIESDSDSDSDSDADVDTVERKGKREVLSVDESGSYISHEDLQQVKEMLTALATATDDHEDIVELLRSIQDQLRLASKKKKDLTLCVKSYRHFLKLKYNK